jgi:hypothetical protein
MADKAMDTYLNDHLAGSMLGSDLAEQIRDRNEGTPLGERMEKIAAEIEEDREILVDLMERMGTDKNPVKQVTAWLAEKASRVKLSGATSTDSEVGNLLSLESLTLGVEGKAGLWKVLIEVRTKYGPLGETDLDGLLARAEGQLQMLEDERRTAGSRAFDPAGA